LIIFSFGGSDFRKKWNNLQTGIFYLLNTWKRCFRSLDTPGSKSAFSYPSLDLSPSRIGQKLDGFNPIKNLGPSFGINPFSTIWLKEVALLDDSYRSTKISTKK